MAKITKIQLRNEIKDNYIQKLIQVLETDGEEVLRIKKHELAIPVIDSQGNEEFVRIVISVPTGSNKGTEPFDGYALEEEYFLNLKKKEEQQKKKEIEKNTKIERDRIYREKKKELKEKREVQTSLFFYLDIYILFQLQA